MDNYSLFESYLSNKLSEKDRLSFEESKKNDTTLEAAFQDHLIMQASLDLLQEEDLKSVIADLKVEEGAKAEGNKFKWSIIGAAAAIAVALVLFTFLNDKTSLNSSEQLIAEYYKSPMDDGTRQGGNPSASKIAVDITQAHTLLHNKDYQGAAQAFEVVVNNSSGREKERAEWFLALSLLESDPPRAKSIIKSITQIQNHIKYQEAIKLLADPRF